MRLILLAVVVAVPGCSTVDDTCDAGDVDCWFEHLEVTSDGLEVARFPGRSIVVLEEEPVPIAANTSRDTQLWVVGENGFIAIDTDQGWVQQQSGTTRNLRSVWAAALNDVWVGGEGLLLHFDGATWENVANPGLVTAISGSGPADVWFATAVGLVHFDGAGFVTVATGFPDLPLSLWVAAPGDVWVGSFSGALLHLSGGQWTRAQSGTTNDLHAIQGLSPSDVYLAANQLLRGGAGGFTPTRPTPFGLIALHANAGQVWGTGLSSRLVRGAPPTFIDGAAARPSNGIYFDGAQAFLVSAQGQLEVVRGDGTSIGSASLGPHDLFAIHGVPQPRAMQQQGNGSRPSIRIDGGVPEDGMELEPGEQKKIAITFDDPCGATPGVCVQVCSPSSRCSNGIICTRAKPDALIRGRFNLGVRYSAAPRGEEEALQLLIGVLDCGCSGCTKQLGFDGMIGGGSTGDGGVPSNGGLTFGNQVGVEQFLLPLPGSETPGGSGGGAGGTGGGAGSGGGSGSNTCDHCVTGQRCSACGTGTACGGRACCAAGEVCMGTFCSSGGSSGHGAATVQQCGITPRYTKVCPGTGGGCCPSCMICNSDGTCSLP